MHNPCDICIVKSCCTAMCENKWHYTNYLNNRMVQFTRKYAISLNTKRKKIFIPELTKLQWFHIIESREINIREINNVLDRGTLDYAESV